MCCFSAPVERVADTKIFARHSGTGTQFLVYSMTYAASRELTMILPLPALTQVANPVRFLNLKNYPQFFSDLDKGFPRPTSRGGAGSFGGATKGWSAPLPVYEVGDYVASFVPTLNDFGRLDPRFTLPRQTWERIPAYRSYGFAVFQLSAARRNKRVQPMAFEFVTAAADRLYFPTIHIHDGQVHPREHFDHALYLQARRVAGTPSVPAQSAEEARRFLDIERTQGIVAGTERCYKMTLRGQLPNRDIFVGAG